MLSKQAVRGPAVQAYIGYFGGEFDPEQNPAALRSFADELNPQFVGSRMVALRCELRDNEGEWSEEDKRIILEAARELGILDKETPLTNTSDGDEAEVTIIVGGANMSNLDRGKYAAEAITLRGIASKVMVFAGVPRLLKPAEQEKASCYAAGANDEFDLCAGAAQTIAREYQLVTGQLFVNDVNAGTPGVIRAVMRALPWAKRYSVVTTQLYQPWTLIDALRVAKEEGCEIICVAGNPSDPAIADNRPVKTVFAEVNRALRSLGFGIEAGI